LSDSLSLPQGFQLVENAVEAKKLLREGAKTFSSAMIWSPDQRYVLNSHLVLFAEKESELVAWIPKNVDPAAFMDDLAKLNQRECVFSVSLSRANIFFKSSFKTFDEVGLRFALPKAVYKVQRRKDLRFMIPDGHVMKLEFQDPLFPENKLVKKVLDVSASGIAVIVDDHELPLFPIGMVLKDVCFSIPGLKILCEAEIRYVGPLPDNVQQRINRNSGKVGLLFKHLREQEKQALAAYVFEETRKFFSKFI